MRDLTGNDDLRKELSDFIQEPGKITAGTKANRAWNCVPEMQIFSANTFKHSDQLTS